MPKTRKTINTNTHEVYRTKFDAYNDVSLGHLVLVDKIIDRLKQNSQYGHKASMKALIEMKRRIDDE
jgi:hypothetical protein